MEGLWTIEFGSHAGLFGSGVAVLRDGKIEGGDDSYFYLGSYEPATSEQAFPAVFRGRIETDRSEALLAEQAEHFQHV
jgi:hypothetical protein